MTGLPANLFSHILFSLKSNSESSKMKSKTDKYNLKNSAVLFLVFVQAAAAQTSAVSPKIVVEEDYTWMYLLLAVMVICLGAIVLFWFNSKKKNLKEIEQNEKARKEKNNWDSGSLDADREMEWLRKNKILVNKNNRKPVKKQFPKTTAASIENLNVPNLDKLTAPVNAKGLPVFKFEKIEPAAEYAPLSISGDDALLSAIEQSQDEYEEDEAVRDLALRVLMVFKTRNSVEALSQIALYDLSAALRSKAVVTLMEFNHESVFETILLACADPTREVRASAARGLTRLDFDRADAWARIIETGETGRICQAARAAMESGFVDRSFDRLIHTDKQTAYESFVLLALLLRANEIEPIIKTLKTHKNTNVKLAILHLLKVTKDQNALNELYSMLEDKTLSPELKEGVDKTINEIGLVAV